VHTLVYVLHYLIARGLFDLLVRHGVSPLGAFVLAGLALLALRRARRRRATQRRHAR
jgi:hypothetical protein